MKSRTFGLVLMIAEGAACGSTGSTFFGSSHGGAGGASTTVCEPGRQLACACVGGAQGAQACSSDGRSWETCVCPGSAAGDAGDAAISGPQGAFYLVTSQANPKKCLIAGNSVHAGSVDGGPLVPASCKVSGGGPFVVQGTIGTPDAGSYFDLSVTLDSAASEQNPATGSVTFAADWTGNEPYTGTCTVWVGEVVAPGTAHVQLRCQGLTWGMSTCPVTDGWARFDQCSTD